MLLPNAMDLHFATSINVNTSTKMPVDIIQTAVISLYLHKQLLTGTNNVRRSNGILSATWTTTKTHINVRVSRSDNLFE